MLQLALALATGILLAIPAGLYGGWAGSLFFGVAAAAVVYVVVGRRVGRRVQRATDLVERHLSAGRVESAIAELRAARSLSRWQLGLGRAIDGQLGALIYAHRDDATKARPYLERASPRMWQAQAMLAASHARARRDREVSEVFERAIKRNRKVPLLYAAYAYCEQRRGRRARAIEILARGEKRVPSDDRLRRNLLALQNRKRMQMRGYGADWWALRLEAPPREATQPPPGARVRRR
jgi:tetratricopeptide (TPR) repeat protein